MTAMPDSQKGKSRILEILVFVLLALAGTSFYLLNENQVFPKASIDLKLSKKNIMEIGAAWAEKLDYDSKGAISSMYFTWDSSAKTFLEYEFGTDNANSLMKNEVPVWYWSLRFCKEYKDEEFRAQVAPDGQIVYLSHYIPNDVEIPSLTKDKAEAISRNFIENDLHQSLNKFKVFESSTVKRVHRSDHSFTFEEESKEYKGARIRISASVSGNKISRYVRYLYVPEKWDRKYSTERSNNSLLATIAGAFSSLFTTASFFVFVWALSSGNMRFKVAIAAGILFSCLSLAESFNNFDVASYSYDTARSYNAFVWQNVLSACLAGVTAFISGAGLFSLGESLYRFLYPEKPALEKVFSSKGLRNRSVMVSLLLGYLLCGISMGWVAFYYLCGYKIGFWCPLGNDNYQTLGAAFPFISGIYTGVNASSSEEILYRVVALGLMQKFLRKFWLANLLQALVWGFMHSWYPQQPCYARGIELTLLGLCYGGILKRYGLIPCLVSHYLYDAFCDVRPLMLSNDPFIAWSSAIALAPFALLILTGSFLARKDGYTQEDEIANASIPLSRKSSNQESVVASSTFDYSSLSKRWRIGLITATFLASLFLTFAEPRVIKDYPSIRIGKEQALQLARNSLETRQVASKDFYAVPELKECVAYSASLQYIYEKIGFEKTRALHRELYLGYIWSVRFFKPMDAQEYFVSIRADNGKEYCVTVSREEDDKGVSLTEAEAREFCRSYLEKQHPEYCPPVLESVNPIKRKNRTDYDVLFKVPRYRVGEADFKVSTGLAGNQLSSLSGYWSIPAKWTFDQSKKTLKDEVAGAIESIVFVLYGLAILWWCIGVFRSGVMKWRPAILLAIPMGLLSIASVLNGLPDFYQNYRTTTPMSSYISSAVVNYIAWVAGRFTSNTFGFAIALGVLSIIKPGLSVLEIFKTTFLPKRSNDVEKQRPIWLDAVIISYSYVIINSALSLVWTFCYSYLSPRLQDDDDCGLICSIPDYFSYPYADLNLSSLVNYPVYALLMVGLYLKYLRRFKNFFLVLVIYSIVCAATSKYWQSGLIQFSAIIVDSLVAWIFVSKLARMNLLAYLLYAVVSDPLSHVGPFFRHGTPVFLSETLQLIVFICLPFIYLAYLYSGQGREQASAESQAIDSTPASNSQEDEKRSDLN